MISGLDRAATTARMEWKIARRTSYQSKTLRDEASRVRSMLLSIDDRIEMADDEANSLRAEKRSLEAAEQDLRRRLLAENGGDEGIYTDIVNEVNEPAPVSPSSSSGTSDHKKRMRVAYCP